MRLLILHLSDMHVKDHGSIESFRIQKIADSVASVGYFDRAILVISGDIAFSGTADQYDHAWKLVGNIITKVKKRNNHPERIEVICVPGNHDLNHFGAPKTSEMLQEIRKSNKYESCLNDEFKKQSAFFDFANRNQCFASKGAFDRRILSFDDFKIEVNLINTGIFSILEEDKGLHYLPKSCINELEQPSGANLVFTVMHHSPDWYIDDQKNILEREIYNKSSLVFFGHEHFIGSKALSFAAEKQSQIQAGGCLCNNEDWANSSYHVGILDTNTLGYTHREFRWNNEQKQYESDNPQTIQLANKPSVEKVLRPTEEFLRSFSEDEKNSIGASFSDYFVFPRLQSQEHIKEQQREFVSEDAFLSEINNKKRVIITGFDDIGKTTLLKHLFLHYCGLGYVPLFCEIGSIKGKRPEKIVKNCFEEIYGENSSDYIRFTQVSKEKKAILIDDVDRIDPKSIESFFSYLEKNFELCIFASHEIIDLSLLDRMKAQFNTEDAIPKYQIEPMYADKRKALVEKIVEIKVPDASSRRKTVETLLTGISSQRRFFSLDPGFIIKYVQYFLNNMGEVANNDGNMFSKVFEANLINAVSANNKTKMSIDKVFILLSKTAAFIHFNKAYPISEQDLSSVIEGYNLQYEDTVHTCDFINIAIASRIMIQDESGNGYRFVNKSYLAYFAARDVNREYHETLDETRLNYLLQNACFGINTDILLFVSYITDNIRILQLLAQTIENVTKEWEEFEFSKDKLPKFLDGAIEEEIKAPCDETREREKKNEIELEKETNDLVQTIDIYDYSEEDAEIFINQFIRAAHLLSVAARCLPNFEHMMRKEEKDRFAKIVFRLPNKIFNLWAIETDKEVDEILDYFRKQSQAYYSRKKPLTDGELKYVLQWSAMSLLLDLYNIAAFYSARENTMPLLSKECYLDKHTYSIEHLMMLERQESTGSFLKEAERLFDGCDMLLEKTVIKRVVEHAVVKNDGFTHAQLDRANNKFFPNKQHQKQLMAKRFRQIGKKDE